MDVFDLAKLEERRRASGRSYLEFLHVPALSAGLYYLPAGATDPQRPHAEDEVYHVVAGRAVIRVAEVDREVGPGCVVFVPARAGARFHSITEDLTTLVFFAPAESPEGG